MITQVARNGICGVAALFVVALAAAGCGGGDNRQAAPAEHHLVYVAGESANDTSVWIAGVDGAHPRKLSNGSAGVLSPDGRTVAVQRRGGGIDLLSADGKRSRQLTGRKLHPQMWSRDGKTLYATGAVGPAVVKLLALDTESRRSRTIASGSLYGFDISPDGTQIAYAVLSGQWEIFRIKVVIVFRVRRDRLHQAVKLSGSLLRHEPEHRLRVAHALATNCIHDKSCFSRRNANPREACLDFHYSSSSAAAAGRCPAS